MFSPVVKAAGLFFKWVKSVEALQLVSAGQKSPMAFVTGLTDGLEAEFYSPTLAQYPGFKVVKTC